MNSFFSCCIFLGAIFSLSAAFHCRIWTFTTLSAKVSDPDSNTLHLPVKPDYNFYCKWTGFKACFGEVNVKTIVKANRVSNNKPYYNVFFHFSEALEINGCRSVASQSVVKTITCYNALNDEPITGLIDLSVAVTEPVACASHSVSLTQSDMIQAGESVKKYFSNKNALVTTIEHTQ